MLDKLSIRRPPGSQGPDVAPYELCASPWWVLWAVGLSSAWLLPSFSLLWPSFDLELMAVLCCAALSGALLLQGGASAWSVPPAAWVAAALACVPLLQWATGSLNFFGDAWMAFLYLFGFALAIATGARARRHGQFIQALFLAIAIAAGLSVAIALKQWLGLEGLPVWTREAPPGARPFANLGQPNNLATLVCWGLIAVWHAYLGRRIGGAVALMAAAYLLLGLSLTQSRTGWLVVVAMAIFCIVLRRPLETGRYWRGLLTLLIFFVGCVLTMDALNRALVADATTTLQSRLQAGYRLHHWAAMLEAIRQRPLAGWGWSQVSVAQQAVVVDLPALPELLGYSHNLVLDLLVWNGVPIGALVTVLALGWLIATGLRLRGHEDALTYTAIWAFVLHCLLEYPHAYAYFLLPVGLMIGAIGLRDETSLFPKLPPIVVAGVLAVASALTAWMTVEYQEARASFTVLRFEMARIGSSRNSEPPKLVMLTQLQALATTDRMKIHAAASQADMTLSTRTAERYPAERTLMQHAALAAGLGQTQAARLSLVRLCKLYPKDRCIFAAAIWKKWGDPEYPWVRSVECPPL